MKTGQQINIELELKDHGEINCSVIVNEMEHTSEPAELRVLGKYVPILCSMFY